MCKTVATEGGMGRSQPSDQIQQHGLEITYTDLVFNSSRPTNDRRPRFYNNWTLMPTNLSRISGSDLTDAGTTQDPILAVRLNLTAHTSSSPPDVDASVRRTQPPAEIPPVIPIWCSSALSSNTIGSTQICG
jgi:hypothetical protein